MCLYITVGSNDVVLNTCRQSEYLLLEMTQGPFLAVIVLVVLNYDNDDDDNISVRSLLCIPKYCLQTYKECKIQSFYSNLDEYYHLLKYDAVLVVGKLSFDTVFLPTTLYTAVHNCFIPLPLLVIILT